MRVLPALVVLLLPLSGCVGDDPAPPVSEPPTDVAPFLDYKPVAPDMSWVLEQFDLFVPGSSGNTIHGRVVMPPGDGPFATIVQHTPYTAPGCNTADVPSPVEPPVGLCGEGTFENQFTRRGYVYVHADLRGTGDSDDCLDLRGQKDIADIGALADALAAQPWSNGNVGFIGASYPGSTSHMAALSGSPAVKAVVPIVASTSFYHYHHNSGVPYNGNHALGGTNTGYTQQGVTPTFNPLSGVEKLSNQPLCPHVENAVMHGGLDQSGAYYDWWQERNLRPLASTVTVPVLMAQGLADWNVKPDHVASWFHDIRSENKVFIGGQWGHAYPASDDGACPNGWEDEADDDGDHPCLAPWGSWWEYVTAFFDTYLKEIDTGMFQGSLAWVQDNSGAWHRSELWPLPASERTSLTLDLQAGLVGADWGPVRPGWPSAMAWYACPHDVHNRGVAAVATVEGTALVDCDTQPQQQLVLEFPAFPQDVLLSGVPLLNLTVDTGGRTTHLTTVVDVIDDQGNVIRSRENYGYLNPMYRDGIDHPSPVPTGWYQVSIDLYPQEDLIHQGERLRVTLGSNDSGRSIESYEEGPVGLLDEPGANTLWLPLRPSSMQGTRLA